MLLPLLLGQGAAGLNNYTLTCNSGTYTLTGRSVTLLRSKLLTASAGSYAFTGRTATLVKGRVLSALHGSYAQAGQTVTLLRSKKLVASSGSYSFTGQTATLEKDRFLTASSGSYSLTGQSAVIDWTPNSNAYVLTAQHGAYSVSGQSATLLREKLLIASSGTYAISGQSATVAKDRYLTAESGSYAAAGQSVSIEYSGVSGYELVCSHGTYLLGAGYTDEGYVAEGYFGSATIELGKTAAGNRPKRVYLDRDGEILVFAKPAHAAAYLQAEKASAVVETTTPKRKKAKVVAVQPEAVIQIDVLQFLVTQYALPDVHQYVRNHDYEALLNLYLRAQIMAEEDDIELLLLAA